jgi:flagellar hook-length control protein FliK
MTAPVTTASSVRALPPSGAEEDPTSGSTFASALDGALQPGSTSTDRPGTARGRRDADRGVPAHGRPADRPVSRARGKDDTAGVRAHGHKEGARPDDGGSAKDDETQVVALPAAPVDTTTAQAAVAALAGAAPPWTPALQLAAFPATTAVPVADVGAPVAAAGISAAAGINAAAAADADGTQSLPADASTTVPPGPSTSPLPLSPADLQVLAAAAPGAGTDPVALPPTAAPGASSGVVVGAQPAAGGAPPAVAVSPPPLPAAAAASTTPSAVPMTDDVPPLPADAGLPGTVTAALAHDAQATGTPPGVPAVPADTATPTEGAAAVPAATAAPLADTSGSTGGSSSGETGDQARHDSVQVSLDPAGTVVGTPLPTVQAAAPTAAAAAAPAPPPPPVATQLVQQVAVLAGGPDGTHSLTVVLHPDSLGPVQVQVTLSQGTIDLSMRGAHEQGRAALMGALPDLRRDLEAAGLTCSNVGVDVDTGGSWSAQGGSAGQQAAQQQAAQQWTGQGRGQHDWGDGRFRPWSRPADTGDNRPLRDSTRSTLRGVDVRV